MVLLQVTLILLRAFIVESTYRTGRKRTAVWKTCKWSPECIFIILKGIQVVDHAKTTGVVCECLVRKVMYPVSL